MGFFDSVKEGFEKVVKDTKDAYDRERNSSRQEQRDAASSKSKTVKNADGTYTTTDSKGNKITSGFAPGEAVRKNAGSGFDMYNPELIGAADNRGVGLYSSYRGGKMQTTPQFDAGYIARDGGFGMDYTRMHMNPLEFMNAYNREQSGQRVNWQQEGYAGQYSPVPETIRNLQDLYKQLGYNYMGMQMPQQPTTLPYPTAPNGNAGINPGGTMYAGGTPNFDERTGQYRLPYDSGQMWGGGNNPTTGLPYGMGWGMPSPNTSWDGYMGGFNPYGGGYGYGGYGGMNGGINPGGMYSGGYMGGSNYFNFDPTSMLMSMFRGGLFG